MKELMNVSTFIILVQALYKFQYCIVVCPKLRSTTNRNNKSIGQPLIQGYSFLKSRISIKIVCTSWSFSFVSFIFLLSLPQFSTQFCCILHHFSFSFTENAITSLHLDFTLLSSPSSATATSSPSLYYDTFFSYFSKQCESSDISMKMSPKLGDLNTNTRMLDAQA